MMFFAPNISLASEASHERVEGWADETKHKHEDNELEHVSVLPRYNKICTYNPTITTNLEIYLGLHA